MKIIFDYDKAKDIWCLLNKGKSSKNSSSPTKVYELLTKSVGANPTEQGASKFIDTYIKNNQIDINECIKRFEDEWASVAEEFQVRAQDVFKVSLASNVKAYLTVNNRMPYSINGNYFFLCMESESIIKPVMHELWHFYTWYSVGKKLEKELGNVKYNDLKESLTVLLNVECADLMPAGVKDEGYPQHQQMREKILQVWSENKSINSLVSIIDF